MNVTAGQLKYWLQANKYNHSKGVKVGGLSKQFENPPSLSFNRKCAYYTFWRVTGVCNLDFKLSPCSECYMLSSG